MSNFQSRIWFQKIKNNILRTQCLCLKFKSDICVLWQWHLEYQRHNLIKKTSTLFHHGVEAKSLFAPHSRRTEIENIILCMGTVESCGCLFYSIFMYMWFMWDDPLLYFRHLHCKTGNNELYIGLLIHKFKQQVGIPRNYYRAIVPF